jgi:hypothetical protein
MFQEYLIKEIAVVPSPLRGEIGRKNLLKVLSETPCYQLSLSFGEETALC